MIGCAERSPRVRAPAPTGCFTTAVSHSTGQDGGATKVFTVASYTDDNNLEGGDSIRYLWTTAVKSSASTTSEDKPSLAVDIPRPWSGFCVIPILPLQNTQFFRAGTVYVAWTEFTGDPDTGPANILFSRSVDCGLTWSPVQRDQRLHEDQSGRLALAIDPNTGVLYISWRVFASTNPTQTDSLMYSASFDGGSTFSKPALIANISPFDQGDTGVSFRTNAYPSIAVDAASHVYVAWSQRGPGPMGDARVTLLTGAPTAVPHNTPLLPGVRPSWSIRPWAADIRLCLPWRSPRVN